MEWIHDPKTEPEIFINEFVKHGGRKNGDEMEAFSQHYTSGYCWHFAHTLQSVFGRGEVCWTAPFGHMVWLDTDGTAYDIEGKFQRTARYLIPERYISRFLNEFTHITGMDNPTGTPSTKQDLIDIVKKYCTDNNEPYDNSIERYLT